MSQICVMASGERETKDQNSVQKNQLSLEEEHSGKKVWKAQMELPLHVLSPFLWTLF